MRVLLVANYLPDSQESMQRFGRLMHTGLALAGHQVRIIYPSVIAGRLFATTSGLSKWLGYADKFLFFPRSIKSAIGWAEVVHICDHSNSIYIRHLRRKPHLVTCHDMLAIRSALGEVAENHTRPAGRHLQRMILGGLKQAQHIVCVSDTTRMDVLRIGNIPEERVSIVPNGLNYPYAPMSTSEVNPHLVGLGLRPDEPFVLHVGGNQWYKNRLGVLRIFSRLTQSSNKRVKLVMAGKPWTTEMREFALKNGLLNSAIELTTATDEDLRALYSAAALLIFPSLSEGFGWPIIEAQACGCLVVTSNRPPMNEVGGSAAIYIDPLDVNTAARVIANALPRASQVREASLRNATKFQKSTMVDQYVAAYQRVASS